MIQQLISGYRNHTQLKEGGEIPALHGIRALMVGIVAAFHIWQHSWLTPAVHLAGRTYSLDPLLRSGYMWVDGMLLLSGLLCYLPYAWAGEMRRPYPAVLPFYRRRFFRIVPTYLLNLLVVLLVVALPMGAYTHPWHLWRDLLAHFTFTHNLFAFSSLHTPLNGVLWTLAVEVQFYLLFPFLARAFRRMPVATYLGMAGVAFGFRAWAAAQPHTIMYVNQLPAFLDVYANGFVAASVFVSLRRRMKEDGWTRILMSVCALAALVALATLVRGQAAEMTGERIRLGQMERRYLQSVLTALAMLGLSLGLGGVRLVLGNPVTRVLSQLSFQLYMWHQVIATQLRRWGIPHSSIPDPNQQGDIVWQRQYVWLCWLLALGLSAALTYLVEQPLSRRFSGPTKKKA